MLAGGNAANRLGLPSEPLEKVFDGERAVRQREGSQNLTAPMERHGPVRRTIWRGIARDRTGGEVHQPVLDDAVTGVLTYTVTATHRFGRTASFTPFSAEASQLTIVQ